MLSLKSKEVMGVTFIRYSMNFPLDSKVQAELICKDMRNVNVVIDSRSSVNAGSSLSHFISY